MSSYRDRKWPIPANPGPLETLCYQIDLPNDPQFLAAFVGAIFELSYWFNFDADPLKQGRIVAATWLKAVNTLRLCQSSTATSGGGTDVELMIRQNPTNPCLLESSIDGVNWCMFADFSKCLPAGNQPGSGAPQPPSGGGTQQYCIALQASGELLLPAVVSTGDVLTLDSATGAGSDPSFNQLWYCPDGEQFFAGACVGYPQFQPTAPLPSVAHMALIYKFGGAYYNATAGPITVPAGVTNAPVTIQVNAATLAGNAGSYDVCVTVKNNAAAAWTHVLDVSLAAHGWIPRDMGVWTPGTGFTDSTVTYGTTIYRGADIQFTSPTPFTLTQLGYTANNTPGGGASQIGIGATTPGVYITTPAMVAGVHTYDTGLINLPGTTHLYLDNILGAVAGADPGGSCALTTILVSGTGFDPFA